ncbi:MAG: hypothetical protein RIF34_00320, partial [Candidatus Kapaibacterium sp.]
DTVLKIRVKYTTDVSSTGSIQFNTLPSNIVSNTTELFGFSGNSMISRGIFRNEVSISPSDTVIIIRKSMIPSDGTPITISSRFYTNKDNVNHNFSFKGKNNSTEKIVSLDIEVDYYGNLDVGLDWLRIENIYTPNLGLFLVHPLLLI